MSFGTALGRGLRTALTPLVIGLCAFGLIVPLAFFRHSRSLWLAMDHWIESFDVSAPKS